MFDSPQIRTGPHSRVRIVLLEADETVPVSSERKSVRQASREGKESFPAVKQVAKIVQYGEPKFPNNLK